LFPIGNGAGWQGHYPGKLFEYMASGTPILLVGPDGDAASLVRSSGTGLAISADDPQAIVNALRLLARQPEEFRARYYRPCPEVIDGYERRALTQRLAALFDNLLTENVSP
jgi:glycosyltransferase involved in cell wall biosynthesis